MSMHRWWLVIWVVMFLTAHTATHAAPVPPEQRGCTTAPVAVGEWNWIGVPAHYRLYGNQPGLFVAPDWSSIPVWDGTLAGPTYTAATQSVQVRSVISDGTAIVCPVQMVYIPVIVQR